MIDRKTWERRMLGSIMAAIAFLSVCLTCDVWAYTYAYHNSTDYPVRVVVHFYDEADQTARIETKGSHVISTPSLLKSWAVEAFLDNRWIQILNLTCDYLPGDHNFSIYVKENNESKGDRCRSWGVLDGIAEQPNRGR